MNQKMRIYGTNALKAILALVFIGAGGAKLAGAEQMVAVFEAIDVGQWFRYLTGGIEVACAGLLFVPRAQAISAFILVCTMIGAVLCHLFILGPSAIPAIVLGVLSAIILYVHRDQLPHIGNETSLNT